MPAIDLVICGSVAVNAQIARMGKGAGYSDIELEAGLSTAETTIVHELQVIDGPRPETEHDFRVTRSSQPRESSHALRRDGPQATGPGGETARRRDGPQACSGISSTRRRSPPIQKGVTHGVSPVKRVSHHAGATTAYGPRA
jgi:hypothetical protein